MTEYAPCSTCKQYSHSIADGRVGVAFRHFHTMYAHPVRDHPMGHIFDDATRDHAQVLVARIRELEAENERLSRAVCSGVLGNTLEDEETVSYDPD